MEVGFAGLGRMGRPMARHLAALAVTPDVPAISEPYRGATA